ncbi:hypothetical protein F5887DRAFT_672674 [Amanita rubescens]|nr:hypothetical protein F5887DRAFT_672674 [Amanita rubescens]
MAFSLGPEDYEPSMQGQIKAIENAWTTQYRGEAPVALWTRIKKAMEQVIPINLRGFGETGYPPPDEKARDYLSWRVSPEDSRVRAAAFLRAVFKEASKLITELRKPLPEGTDCHDQIVDLFSKYMSEGMRWESHGDKRRSFYDKVHSGASKLEGEIEQAFATNKRRSLEDQLASVGIREAFEELIVTLSSVRKSRSEPLVILAFDEARTITKPGKNQSWSPFSELRRALRALINQPLFSLFLTTTGNVNALVPTSSEDLSRRMQIQALPATRPFVEVGFDHFAFKNQLDLRVVASDEHISHFGRPLWATRCDNGNDTVRSGIIQFAAQKLCAGRIYKHGESLSTAVQLACLAQRLPIEFHSVTYASKASELQLVEGHMRILLQLDAGLESLTTVSVSEPLLSEAAYWMMNPDTTFKAAEALKSCLDGYAIHKGDRGELLVMLLFTLARDRAIGDPNSVGQPISGRRWCSVPRFMKKLFKFRRHPSSNASLKDLFANSKIFFNHWVKVHQYAIVNVRYLAHLMRRGAALLCATNQAGIIPFLLAGYDIIPKNIGVILWQVKNDSKYTDKPDLSLFKAMDPYALGILNPGDNIPIIRIVFALASKTPCLTRVECSQDGFCDFWVGGISSTVFSPVKRASGWHSYRLRMTGKTFTRKTPTEKGLVKWRKAFVCR